MPPPGYSPRRTRASGCEIYYIDPGLHQAPDLCDLLSTSRELFHFSYQRYLENQIRETFGLDGTPIRIIPRGAGQGQQVIQAVRKEG